MPQATQFSLSERRYLPTLLPLLLDALQRAPDAGYGAQQLRAVRAGHGARDSPFSLLNQNPALLKILIRLFGHSEYLAQLLILHPDLMNLFLDPETLEARRTRAEIASELSTLLSEASPRPNSMPSAISRKPRNYGSASGRSWVKADIQRTLPDLTEVADLCLSAALQSASEEMEAHYGIPQIQGGNQTRRSQVTLIDLGKLGGHGLNFGSDLDILFVYDEEGETKGIPGRMERLGVASPWENTTASSPIAP